jgi:ABC-2 type transport system ATP-binding protein
MPALLIDNLHKTYPNHTHALKGISLTIEEGDFFALLGPNGAGKSTTIGILCSLVKKTSGRVQIFDKDLDQHPNDAKAYIGIVPQEFNFNIFDRVKDIVTNQAGFYGIPRPQAVTAAEHALKQVDLWDKRDTVARTLSGGMKRRLMIARAIVHNPRMLILDEPTAGVDIEIRRTMWHFLQKINQEGTTIILTTHYLEEAEQLCKNVAIIDKGNIIENTSVRKLLASIKTQSFIIELAKPLDAAPHLPGFKTTWINAETLEIETPEGLLLNELFKALSQANIPVSGLRNKSNRLEALFLTLTGHKA